MRTTVLVSVALAVVLASCAGGGGAAQEPEVVYRPDGDYRLCTEVDNITLLALPNPWDAKEVLGGDVSADLKSIFVRYAEPTPRASTDVLNTIKSMIGAIEEEDAYKLDEHKERLLDYCARASEQLFGINS